MTGRCGVWLRLGMSSMRSMGGGDGREREIERERIKGKEEGVVIRVG